MKIRISPTQIQKQILAPSMQQSIEVLQLPVAELYTAIEQELQENPLLESDERKSNLDVSSIEDLINKKTSSDQGQASFQYTNAHNDDELIEEKPIARQAPLEEYLLQQLRLEVSEPLELEIGELIIGNLNEDGYFESSCEEIAQLLGIKNIAIVEDVLHIIQNFEPLGIASRNLRECLITQVHYHFNGNSEPLIELINNHLDKLGKRKYADIARDMKMSIEQTKRLAQTITTLEPKPARNYRPITSNLYIKPDLSVYQDANEEYQLRINNEYVPELRINHTYKNLLKKKNISQEEKSFIHEKIKNALFFIKSIEQRHHTIKEIGTYILNHQKEFFQHGHMFLKPMTLKDVASVVDRNESTICRAISNKYIETPQGLLPLKFFFSQAVSEDSITVSNRSIKEETRWLIENENKTNPLSDQEIQNHFEERGLKVARRTISKYRQSMNILPSHLRKLN